MSDKVLEQYNLKLHVVIPCDASEFGLEIVLMHRFTEDIKKSVRFASRALKKFKRNYSTIHKEALTVIWKVAKFYQGDNLLSD